MTSISSSQTLTQTRHSRRMVTIAVALALVATLCVVAIIALAGGATKSSGNSTPAGTSASAAQLRQYIGNHGMPQPVPGNQFANGRLAQNYEQQTPGPRP